MKAIWTKIVTVDAVEMVRFHISFEYVNCRIFLNSFMIVI